MTFVVWVKLSTSSKEVFTQKMSTYKYNTYRENFNFKVWDADSFSKVDIDTYILLFIKNIFKG